MCPQHMQAAGDGAIVHRYGHANAPHQLGHPLTRLGPATASQCLKWQANGGAQSLHYRTYSGCSPACTFKRMLCDSKCFGIWRLLMLTLRSFAAHVDAVYSSANLHRSASSLERRADDASCVCVLLSNCISVGSMHVWRWPWRVGAVIASASQTPCCLRSQLPEDSAWDRRSDERLGRRLRTLREVQLQAHGARPARTLSASSAVCIHTRASRRDKIGSKLRWWRHMGGLVDAS